MIIETIIIIIIIIIIIEVSITKNLSVLSNVFNNRHHRDRFQSPLYGGVCAIETGIV